MGEPLRLGDTAGTVLEPLGNLWHRQKIEHHIQLYKNLFWRGQEVTSCHGLFLKLEWCRRNLPSAGHTCAHLPLSTGKVIKWSIRRKSDVSVFHCQYVAKQLFTDLIGLDIGYCLLFKPFNFYFHTEASDCDKTLETSANSKVASLLAAALGKGDGPSMQHSNNSFFSANIITCMSTPLPISSHLAPISLDTYIQNHTNLFNVKWTWWFHVQGNLMPPLRLLAKWAINLGRLAHRPTESFWLQSLFWTFLLSGGTIQSLQRLSDIHGWVEQQIQDFLASACRLHSLHFLYRCQSKCKLWMYSYM